MSKRPTRFKKRYALLPLTLLAVLLFVFLVDIPLLPKGQNPAEIQHNPVMSTGVANIGGSFNLQDDDGNPVSEQTLVGDKFTLLFFGFTNCPDVCPAMLQMMADTMAKLPAETQAKLRMIFVSVDPARDDAHTLKAYVDGFDPRFTGWTGTKEQVDAMTKKYLAYYSARAPQNPSETNVYRVDHSAFLYLMDRSGTYVTHFPNTIAQADLIAKLTGLTKN